MYQSLFNIRYRHEYFDLKPLLNMEYGWTSGMDTLIKNMGLLMVPTDGEICILFDQSRFDREALLNAWEDETLVMYFTPKESSNFYNVTKGLDKLIRAHEPIDGDDNKIPKHFRFYQYEASNTTPMDGVDLPLEALEEVKTLEDFGYLGEKMPENSINKPEITFDRKRTQKQPSLDVTTIKKIATNTALFVVGVKINEIIKAVKDDVVKPALTLLFRAEEVHYKYYFTTMPPDERLQIVADDANDNDGIDYEAVAEEVVGTKSIAAFISSKPLALRWQHDKYFKLVRQVRDVSQTLIEKLPHPDPTRCYKHKKSHKDQIKVLESFIN